MRRAAELQIQIPLLIFNYLSTQNNRDIACTATEILIFTLEYSFALIQQQVILQLECKGISGQLSCTDIRPEPNMTG